MQSWAVFLRKCSEGSKGRTPPLQPTTINEHLTPHSIAAPPGTRITMQVIIRPEEPCLERACSQGQVPPWLGPSMPSGMGNQEYFQGLSTNCSYSISQGMQTAKRTGSPQHENDPKDQSARTPGPMKACKAFQVLNKKMDGHHIVASSLCPNLILACPERVHCVPHTYPISTPFRTPS